VCGRPDGRLAALTSLEATTCLSVNQASSIQSLGGTCESVTIGHNPYKLPLSARAVFLNAHRPKFLCETILDGLDKQEAESRRRLTPGTALERNSSHHRLMGVYSDLKNESANNDVKDPTKHEKRPRRIHSIESIVEELLTEKLGMDKLRKIFDEVDANGNGVVDIDEFIPAFQKNDPTMSADAARKIFEELDADESGFLDFDEFASVSKMPKAKLPPLLVYKNRSNKGLLQVKPSKEKFFGEDLRKNVPASIGDFSLARSQEFSMELYESRIASLQRFVAMTVMFHQMGSRVQGFFPRMSLGLLGYRMDRTHSIMRIATTASPVSGADVRERMEVLRLTKTVNQAVATISRSWLRYRRERDNDRLRSYSKMVSTSSLHSELKENSVRTLTESTDLWGDSTSTFDAFCNGET
jgi:hypothetical protein